MGFEVAEASSVEGCEAEGQHREPPQAVGGLGFRV